MKRFHKIFRVTIILAGAVLGASIVDIVFRELKNLGIFDITRYFKPWLIFLICLAGAVVMGIVMVPLSARMLRGISRLSHHIQKMPTRQIVCTVIGLIGGLFTAFLMRYLVLLIPMGWAVAPLTVLLYIVLGIVGANLGYSKLSEAAPAEAIRRSMEQYRESRREGSEHFVLPKVVDTSTIIDGRIYDVLESGFLEGTIVIPGFVLTELQRVSDSADDLKRSRGRRGLDIVARIQKELPNVPVEISSRDFANIPATDDKLIALAKELNAKIITNDFNLNKVASVQGIGVLNINVLANAVKAITVPGEQMQVRVVREGREAGQGLAYMADGTMVVIEGAQSDIGQQISVVVTSSLQTPAGRMVFAKKAL